MILSNGVVQLGNSLYGMGSISVEGKLKLCGSMKSMVNISGIAPSPFSSPVLPSPPESPPCFLSHVLIVAVDILDGGKFEVWYKDNKDIRDCFDFPQSTR